MNNSACPLCTTDNEIVLWQGERCRVIRVEDADYPAYCRVIWQQHIKEMTDLPRPDQHYVLDVMLALEATLREHLNPVKINLASFGNMVPHLHWHVIPRFEDDRHFPQPVWGQTQRRGMPHAPASFEMLQATLTDKLNDIK